MKDEIKEKFAALVVLTVLLVVVLLVFTAIISAITDSKIDALMEAQSVQSADELTELELKRINAEIVSLTQEAEYYRLLCIDYEALLDGSGLLEK